MCCAWASHSHKNPGLPLRKNEPRTEHPDYKPLPPRKSKKKKESAKTETAAALKTGDGG